MSSRSFSIYRYFGRRLVGGWLAPEVLEVLAVLNDAQSVQGVRGSVAEIGVHHGKLMIALDLLRNEGEGSVAIDLFDDQTQNVDNSGKGDLSVFRRNLARWSRIDALAVHAGDSTKLAPETLAELTNDNFRLFSVDGGHDEPVVFSDLKLAETVLTPGGIIIADDVFHQEWPGVMTGLIRYLNQDPKLVPFVIGFNKVFLTTPEFVGHYQRAVDAAFSDRYLTSVKESEFFGNRVSVVARVRRTPRLILRRNKTLRRAYNRIRDMRGSSVDLVVAQ
jgi:Methyltransferase domain